MSKKRKLSPAQKLKKRNQSAKQPELVTQQHIQTTEKALGLVKAFGAELVKTRSEYLDGQHLLDVTLWLARFSYEQAPIGSKLSRLLIKFGSDLTTVLEMAVEDNPSITPDELLRLVDTYQYPWMLTE